MNKENKKIQIANKKQEEFDSIFDKYAKQLPKEYIQQFKRPEDNTIVKQVKIRNAQRQGKVEIVQKTTGNKKGEIKNLGKLLEDEGINNIKKNTKEIALQVAKFRNENNLTQDQLAKKISEPLNDLNDLENSIGVYKPNLVNKIERALGVKIDRPWKNRK